METDNFRLISASSLREKIDSWMSCELEQDDLDIGCIVDILDEVLKIVDDEPTVSYNATRPAAHVVWRERMRTFTSYDPIHPGEGEYWSPEKKMYIQRTTTIENAKVPFCSECDHRLDDLPAIYCPYCGFKLEKEN